MCREEPWLLFHRALAWRIPLRSWTWVSTAEGPTYSCLQPYASPAGYQLCSEQDAGFLGMQAGNPLGLQAALVTPIRGDHISLLFLASLKSFRIQYQYVPREIISLASSKSSVVPACLGEKSQMCSGHQQPLNPTLTSLPQLPWLSLILPDLLAFGFYLLSTSCLICYGMSSSMEGLSLSQMY